MTDIANFLGIKPDKKEERFLVELTHSMGTILKKIARFDDQGKILNEQELDDHPASQGAVKLLSDRGFDADKLDLVGFPHLAFLFRRVKNKK